MLRMNVLLLKERPERGELWIKGELQVRALRYTRCQNKNQ